MDFNFIVIHLNFCLAFACRMEPKKQNKKDRAEKIQKVSFCPLLPFQLPCPTPPPPPCGR